ncbi:hypothetical protein OGAPHI_003184 [Ogataea philodendri]|uniref:Uncharacterized protein n=1 Tax=Ogataea philodendri TaxID=1378263 RepID=A0A9P8P7N9_9ASCO|nr:uncharacterized protein OGAPHI_003184 [Ogataea philodendri]KAH3666735.1 hypothetical protein OGAPHI_003184 [Ogataea philodendri]
MSGVDVEVAAPGNSSGHNVIYLGNLHFLPDHVASTGSSFLSASATSSHSFQTRSMLIPINFLMSSADALVFSQTLTTKSGYLETSSSPSGPVAPMPSKSEPIAM